MSEVPENIRRLRARLGAPEPESSGAGAPGETAWAPEPEVPLPEKVAETPEGAASVRARRLGSLAADRAPLPDLDGFLETPHVERPAPAPERRVFAVLATLASIAVGVALATSWVLPSGRTLLGQRVSARAATPAQAGRVAKLPKDPKAMLPDFIVSYETIDRHAVPGSNGTASEAIYQTYDMNTTMITHTTIYARVDGYATEARAAAALQALQVRYPVAQRAVGIKFGLLGHIGYAADSKAMVAAWRSGRYVTYVKTSFTDTGAASAAKSQEILERLADPVFRTVAVYQSRGLQGVEANQMIFGTGASVAPSSTLGAVDESAGVAQ